MYYKEYESLVEQLEQLQGIPDAYKDDDMREDIKSLLILLSNQSPDNCIEGTCEF